MRLKIETKLKGNWLNQWLRHSRKISMTVYDRVFSLNGWKKQISTQTSMWRFIHIHKDTIFTWSLPWNSTFNNSAFVTSIFFFHHIIRDFPAKLFHNNMNILAHSLITRLPQSLKQYGREVSLHFTSPTPIKGYRLTHAILFITFEHPI